jgi:hypothetical protein
MRSHGQQRRANEQVRANKANVGISGKQTGA